MKLALPSLAVSACLVVSLTPSLLGCSGGGGAGGAGGGTTSATTGTGTTTGTGSTSSSATTTSSSGSTTSSSSTGGGMAQAECATAADCKLVDDCCNCEAIPKTQMDPQCSQQCLQSACMALGVTPTVDCQAGRCIAAFDCDGSKVTCLTPQPVCPAGETNLVNGLCWTQQCVPVTQCAFVDDCAACTATQACVFYGGGIMKRHCVDVPPECNGTPSCACMGQMICGNIPCGGTGNQLDCQIP